MLTLLINVTLVDLLYASPWAPSSSSGACTPLASSWLPVLGSTRNRLCMPLVKQPITTNSSVASENTVVARKPVARAWSRMAIALLLIVIYEKQLTFKKPYPYRLREMMVHAWGVAAAVSSAQNTGKNVLDKCGSIMWYCSPKCVTSISRLAARIVIPVDVAM